LLWLFEQKFTVNHFNFTIPDYVIKFVGDLWQIGGFLLFAVTLVSSTTKTECHDIAVILLKVVLNTIRYGEKIAKSK
jgi:hypothetical protein